MTITMTIKRKKVTVASLREASEAFCAERDSLNYGASTFPSVNLYEAGEIIGHVSYNGRIWQGERGSWHPSAKPIYDNRTLSANA